MSTFNQIFTSKDAETRKKINSFERICFIIFSAKVDKYDKDLNSLLDKMSEVIRTSDLN